MASSADNDNDSDQVNPGSAFEDYYKQFGDDPYPSKTQYEKEFGDREEDPYPSEKSYDKDFGDKEADNESLEAAETDTNAEESSESDESKALKDGEEKESFVFNAGGKIGDANIARKKRSRYITKLLLIFLFPTISLVTMFVLSGPLKLMQIGKMFEKFHMGANTTSSNSRIGRALEFINTSGANDDKSRRNLGVIATAVSGRMQTNMKAKGMEIKYTNPDGSNNRRMQSMEIDTNTPEGKRLAEGLKSEGFTVPDPGGNGKTTVDFRGEGLSARQRRKALNISIDVQGKNKVTSALSKRLLRARAGVDFHPLRNKTRDVNEKITDWREKRKKERAERNTNGSDPPDASINGGTNTDSEGTSSPDTVSGDGAEGSNDIVKEAGKADTPSIKKGLAKRLGGGAAAVVGVLCILKNDIGDKIPEVQHATRVLPAVRTGMELVAVSSQVQAGFSGADEFPNLEEMQIYSDLIDGTPLPSSPVAFLSQKALAQEPPSDREIASSKPLVSALSIERQNGNAVGGIPAPSGMEFANDVSDKPALFEVIDGIPVLDTACDIQTGIGNFLKSIPLVGTLVSYAEDASAALIDGALGLAGTSLEEIMSGVISWFAKDPLDVSSAAGALLGWIADVGVFLAEKEQGNAIGGTELTNPDLVALKQDAWESEEFIRGDKSYFARMFDIRDTDSMLAQVIMKGPSLKTDNSVSQNVAALYGSTIGNMTSISSLFTTKAKAQAPIAFDYGVKASGFSLGELEAEITENPHANADIVEPRLAELNEKYSGCFGTKIDPTTFAMTFEQSPNYEKIGDSKCKDGSDILVRYRFYILDSVSIRSMACYEGLDEQSCKELGVEGNTAPTTGAGSTLGNTSPTSGDLPDFVSDADCPSSPGITDAGTGSAIRNDVNVQFKLCNVLGTATVNTVYATNFLNLFNGARAAGFDLTGGGGSYASIEGALNRWTQRCGSRPISAGYAKPPCIGAQIAPPGKSNHEIGLAVDLNCGGGLLGGGTQTRAAYRRDDPCVTWVRTNSPTWGLILQCERVRADGTQSDSCESWHISPTGG